MSGGENNEFAKWLYEDPEVIKLVVIEMKKAGKQFTYISSDAMK